MASWIDEAVRAGGTLVCGGQRDGALLTPAIIDQPPTDSRVYRNEVFGPVLTVNTFDNFERALEMANDSDFGLHAGVFTDDFAEALRVIDALEFGGVLINEVPTFRSDHQPYGGDGDSGNTREGPAYTVREFTEEKLVLLGA